MDTQTAGSAASLVCPSCGAKSGDRSRPIFRVYVRREWKEWPVHIDETGKVADIAPEHLDEGSWLRGGAEPEMVPEEFGAGLDGKSQPVLRCARCESVWLHPSGRLLDAAAPN